MYRIGELARLADVTPDTIRYYEKQSMMEHEVRTEGGFRLYTDADLQRLRFIRYAIQARHRLPPSLSKGMSDILSRQSSGLHPCSSRCSKGIVSSSRTSC